MSLAELKSIIEKKYLHRGDFTLSSGAKSDKYFDIKSMMGGSDKPLLIRELLNFVTDKFAKADTVDDKLVFSFGSLGGTELGGALMVSVMCHPFNIDCCFIRKQQRIHGLKKMIEGCPKSPILLVDDVISTSHTVADAVQTCIDNGFDVCGVLCVVDRRKVDKGDEGKLLLMGMDKVPNGIYPLPIYSLFKESDFE
jgi:orotate phosphoribosyltransferase